MDTKHKVALAALGLVGLIALAAPHGTKTPSIQQREAVIQAQTRARLVELAPASRHDIDYAAFDARLQRMIANPAMVGMAVGIVENGRITFLRGYGETLAKSGDPVTPETVFRWASCSKGVAATMVAKLAEQGKMSLEDPVYRDAPSLRLPGGNEVRATVADVLSHRLGLYRNAFDNKLEEGVPPKLLRSELATLSSVCQPGTCWNYQNVAYDAASEVVEQKTGIPYRDEVKRALFDPIGMSSASVTRAGLQSAKSWARPHGPGRRPFEVNDIYYGVPAAGGMNSNIKDMALWLMAQMGEMPLVLDQRLLDTIHAPLVATPLERQHLRKFQERVHDPMYGLGWRSYDYDGHHIIGHRGGVNGYRSLILFDPARKTGIVALWNSNTWQPGGMEFEVMDMIYHLPFRDWMELDRGGGPVAAESADDSSSGDAAR